MRDSKARLVLRPFSMGCGSKSSVALGRKDDQPKKQKHSTPKILLPPPTTNIKEGKEKKSGSKVRNIGAFLALPKYGLSKEVNGLLKRFKSFSKLLVYNDEDEEVEIEMEIGLPTDVKHITHIGWDGSTTVNPLRGWQNLETPEMLSLSSISLKQFELAMATQANIQPVNVGSTKMT
ncbi:hypothetical protein ACH5RR_032005 [Cinchona calisaya]|uniref:CRIB domain-containing protein n=1 Tax=Cinchona calisaya TaxID=153742 RepID=A0ABD2YGV3_9GENT